MATNFPGSQDSFTNPTSSDNLDSPDHAAQHANVNDAVEAIELALLDGAPLKIDDTNERVGIGTTSPSAELDVAGDYTSTGHVTAQSGGADGGIVLGQAFSSSYVGLRTAGMSETSGNEYILISDGTSTFLSSGSGGSTRVRGPANDSGNELRITDTQNLFSGATYVDGDEVWHRGDLRGGSTSGTTDTNGYLSFAHGLGKTPDFAFVGARLRLSSDNDSQLVFPITAINSSNIQVRAYEVDGSGNSGYNVSTIRSATIYIYFICGDQ